jgi:hypothetical protein
MVMVNPRIEGGRIAREVFKPDPKFLGVLQLAIRVIVGPDGAVDLRTGGEPVFHGAAGEAFGVSAKGSRCPSHEHGAFFAGFWSLEKLKRRADLPGISP